MPTTDYKRDERLPIIHKCLKNDMGKWSVKKLHEKVNSHLESIGGKTVSERTIADDLKYLEFQKGAPIEVIRKGKNIFYTYSEDFELNAQTITKDESLSLIMANEVLSQLKGFTLTKELKDLTDKLKLQIDDNMQSNSPAVIFDVQPVKHIEQLQDFLECILEKTVLQISYQPFGIATAIEKIIHPYFLKQYNQRWFLFGYDEANKRIDNSPVDRIIQFKPVNRPFIENSFFLQHEYFNDMVGVTKKEGQKAEHIIFEVSAARADYLVTKPLHQSQTILSRQSNGNITFQMDVIINKELISMLLSFGSDLVVIAPSLLKQVLGTEFKNCYKQYSEPA